MKSVEIQISRWTHICSNVMRKSNKTHRHTRSRCCSFYYFIIIFKEPTHYMNLMSDTLRMIYHLYRRICCGFCKTHPWLECFFRCVFCVTCWLTITTNIRGEGGFARSALSWFEIIMFGYTAGDSSYMPLIGPRVRFICIDSCMLMLKVAILPLFDGVRTYVCVAILTWHGDSALLFFLFAVRRFVFFGASVLCFLCCQNRMLPTRNAHARAIRHGRMRGKAINLCGLGLK